MFCTQQSIFFPLKEVFYFYAEYNEPRIGSKHRKSNFEWMFAMRWLSVVVFGLCLPEQTLTVSCNQLVKGSMFVEALCCPSLLLLVQVTKDCWILAKLA